MKYNTLTSVDNLLTADITIDSISPESAVPMEASLSRRAFKLAEIELSSFLCDVEHAICDERGEKLFVVCVT